MPSERSTNPLKGLLDEAKSELTRRLHEACEAEAKGAVSGSAEEIRRLEDTLLSAALAAERAIVARRHLDATSSAAGSGDTATSAPAAPRKGPSDESNRATEASNRASDASGEVGTGSESTASNNTGVREFEDETGRSWRAWPVTPDVSHNQGVSRRSLGDFQEGWICFEALDNSGRRRLPRRGRRWSDLLSEDLPRLLDEAISVPARKKISS